MDISEIRRTKLRQYRDQIGGDTKLSEMLDRSLSQIGQIIGDNPTRNIGNKLARDIEDKIGKPRNWLDSNQAALIEIDDESDFVSIKRVEFKLSAGVSGYAIEYLNGERAPIIFRKDWLIKRGFVPEKLFAVTVTGQSMETNMFEDDLVVVNVGDSKPTDGEVFAVNYEGELVIKRMLREAGDWWLSSDNPDKRRYPNKLCHEDCFIIGRIVHRQTERI